MYNKILIANRGEIAIRVIRACRELGIKTVAVYSTADADALHVRLADEAICIGAAPTKESYLKIPSLIAATEVSGAEAIHPGYGFLSEDANFVEKCTASGINFIGPSAEIIQKMGDKVYARKMAKKAGCPITPGTGSAIEKADELFAEAKKIGYPVILKAAAGGGGRGMRIVYSKGSLLNAFETAKAEAGGAFNDDAIFMEKYIEKPRHVEVQLLGDKHGNVIVVSDRDCSIQRRNQKLIEEAPAFGLSDKTRAELWSAATRVAKQVGYFSAGTIEFLLTPDNQFYFMEMNTRLQVEHCVSELVSGVDIVKEMIHVAAGGKLHYTQDDIKIKGHAIECRINAENPDTFIPSPGKITEYHAPSGFGVRVDSAAYQGWSIPPYYDSMVAKVIVHDESRTKAIDKMLSCLSEFIIDGVQVNIRLHRRILHDLAFRKGEIDTSFLSVLLK